MTGYLLSGTLAAALALLPGVAAAQTPAPIAQTPAPIKDAANEVRLNGCIARDKGAPGQFTFQDNDTSTRFRITGKGLKNFVGRRVEIVGGPPGKKVSFRTGLTPSPNTAARASALDPADLAIANLGGAADGTGKPPLPELRVVGLRAVDGGCQ
jgi:hypothetical protein